MILQTAFSVWDDATYGEARFPHGPTGLLIAPSHVAHHLLNNGGYRRATKADIGREVELLTRRLDLLRQSS